MRLDVLFRLVGLAASILIAPIPDASAQDTNCSIKNVEVLPNAQVERATDENFACLLTKIEKLTLENRRLRDQLTTGEVPAIRVPRGAVMAFDLQDGCPVGWRAKFEKGQGKFILGVGKGILAYRGLNHRPDDSPDSIDLSEVIWGDQGGSETHILAENEMPLHNHETSETDHSHTIIPHTTTNEGRGTLGFIGGRGRHNAKRSGAESTGLTVESAGRGDPHNNMPPFIALHFCKKE